MKITIEIETGNDAFGNEPESVGAELSRILFILGSRLSNEGAPGSDELTLRDMNGNKVGFYRTTEWDNEA